MTREWQLVLESNIVRLSLEKRIRIILSRDELLACIVDKHIGAIVIRCSIACTLVCH